jgi:hypothetical protein
MSELTLKAIEQMLDAKLQPIKAGMAHLATSQELAELKADLEGVKITQARHTTSLELLLTKKKIKDDETTIAASRVDRLEHWAQLVGQKLDIKLEL